MLNFVKFLNDNTPNLTAAKRKDMLDDLAESFQYKTMVEVDGTSVPNPQSKADFVNERLTYYIKTRVKNARIERSQRAIAVEELDI
jgi:hypothetical protein